LQQCQLFRLRFFCRWACGPAPCKQALSWPIIEIQPQRIGAANKAYGPIFCFWDEPDNYLSLAEVGHFVLTLRRAFEAQGQIVMTSHNEEAIRKFSNENTWVLGRKSHLEPTQHRLLSELGVGSDVVRSLMLGGLDL
jgi:hypothetical protein